MERHVSFMFEEREVNFYIVIPLPLSRSNVADSIAAFSTAPKDLRRFRIVLRFLNSFSKPTKTQEILKLVEDLICFPENAKETLVFSENFLFVKTSMRHEVLPKRSIERLREEMKSGEILPLDLDELYDGEI